MRGRALAFYENNVSHLGNGLIAFSAEKAVFRASPCSAEKTRHMPALVTMARGAPAAAIVKTAHVAGVRTVAPVRRTERLAATRRIATGHAQAAPRVVPPRSLVPAETNRSRFLQIFAIEKRKVIFLDFVGSRWLAHLPELVKLLPE